MVKNKRALPPLNFSPPWSPEIAAMFRHHALIMLEHCDAADPPMTVASAAAACGRTAECVRQWCAAGALGRWDSAAMHWVILRSELVAYLTRRFGAEQLPAALRILGASKPPDE